MDKDHIKYYTDKERTIKVTSQFSKDLMHHGDMVTALNNGYKVTIYCHDNIVRCVKTYYRDGNTLNAISFFSSSIGSDRYNKPYLEEN